MNLAAYLLVALAFAGGNDGPRRSGGGVSILLPPIGPDPLSPRTLVTPILHVGNPAPGIPDATIALLGKPLIDGEGNLLMQGFFLRDGDPFPRFGIWYHGPAGLVPVAFHGMPAADMPDGVTYFGRVDAPNLAENGTIGFRAWLSGPGIIGGVNDAALFVGQLGNIRKVFQGGDSPPDVEPGTVVRVSATTSSLRPWLTDNATLMVRLDLTGPQVDETNDRGLWIGPPEDMRLIWREGMVAPGTNGARFAWSDLQVCNDLGQVAFRGGLINEGDVDATNDNGQWFGGVGTLQLILREGDRAPFLPQGILHGGSNAPAINTQGEISEQGGLVGEGVTSENNDAHWLGDPELTVLVDRKGDLVESAGPGVVFEQVGGNPFLSAAATLTHRTKYAGAEIDATNSFALYAGLWAASTESLRDGNLAPHMESATILTRVACTGTARAMNDAGDILTVTDIDGPEVTPADKVVVWVRDSLRHQWYPVIRSGMEILGRSIAIETACLFVGFAERTGGSDGMPQSFNDDGQLGVKLEFTDGSDGIYLLRFRWPGDGDGDGDVDLADFAVFQRCAAIASTGLPVECQALDVDQDGDVDLIDYNYFMDAVTGPE